MESHTQGPYSSTGAGGHRRADGTGEKKWTTGRGAGKEALAMTQCGRDKEHSQM